MSSRSHLKWYIRLLSFIYAVVIVRTTSEFHKDIRVTCEFGKLCLYTNGALQSGPRLSSIWKRVFGTLASSRLPKIRNALVLGVGGGDVINIIRFRAPAASIIAVDIDKKIVDLSKLYFGLDSIAGLTVYCNDALKFIKQKEQDGEKFDLIVVDLYHGFEVSKSVLGDVFLKTLRNLVSPSGLVLFNYSPPANLEQETKLMLDKLTKVYESVRSTEIYSYRFFCASVSNT